MTRGASGTPWSRGGVTRRRIAIVAFNALPLAGVLWMGWSIAQLMLLYWAEIVVIGLVMLVRLPTAAIAQGRSGMATAVPVGFLFVLHYGAYCAAYLLLLTIMFIGPPSYADVDSGAVFLQGPRVLIDAGASWAVVALAVPHVWSFVSWLRQDGPRRDAVSGMLGRLYATNILLNLVTILAGAVAVWLGQPVVALALVVLLKIGLDLAADRVSGGRAAREGRSR